MTRPRTDIVPNRMGALRATRWSVAALGLAAMLAATGCAFEDGDPWGEARFAVSTVFDEAGRASDDGFRTAHDYLVVVESLSLELQEIALAMSGGEVVSFDPSDPPEGYLLCHNGHCHSDDGRLVSYEEIAAELAGASATGARTVQALNTSVELEPTETAVPLGDCSNDCWLSRGELATVTLRASGVRARLHVTDRRTGDSARLPESGVDVSVDETGLVEWTVPVSGRLDGRRPPVFELGAALSVPATLVDDIEWSETIEAGALLQAIEDSAAFGVDVSRHDF